MLLASHSPFERCWLIRRSASLRPDAVASRMKTASPARLRDECVGTKPLSDRLMSTHPDQRRVLAVPAEVHRDAVGRAGLADVERAGRGMSWRWRRGRVLAVNSVAISSAWLEVASRRSLSRIWSEHRSACRKVNETTRIRNIRAVSIAGIVVRRRVLVLFSQASVARIRRTQGRYRQSGSGGERCPS
jgi:hypothetical protein